MTYPIPNYGYNSVYKSFSGIGLELTRRCPNNCVFCAKARLGHGNASMSMDDLDCVLARIPNFSGWVTLSGTGDALVLNDLPEKVTKIKKLWPHCSPSITTTFNIWRGWEYIYNLFLAGLDKIFVSCYAHTEEDYMKVHGSQNFSNLLKNISAVAKLPKEFRNKVQIKYFHDTNKIFAINDAEEKRDKFQSLCSTSGIERFETIHCFSWEHPKPLNGKSLWDLSTPCDIVWGAKAGGLHILYDLDVVPCCMMYNKDYVIGNLKYMKLEEIFESKKYNFFYKSWWSMQPEKIPVCNTCRINITLSDRGELARMAAWQAEAVRGKKVIFWGAGEAYRSYKSFFSLCEPLAILIDSTMNKEKKIDGIPIYHPNEFLSTLKEPLPLVIFAMQDASPKILKNLKDKYAFYKPSQIIICPADAQIAPPVQPYF